MAVRITCRGVTLPDKTRTMVLKKVDTLSRYFDRVDKIDVIFSAEKHRRQCELNVHAGHMYTACRVEDDDELSSFDKALKIARRQLKSGKTKMFDRKKAVSRAKTGPADAVEEDEEE